MEELKAYIQYVMLMAFKINKNPAETTKKIYNMIKVLLLTTKSHKLISGRLSNFDKKTSRK